MGGPLSDLGPALRLLRERARMTQATLQELAKLGPGSVSEWERGVSAPHPKSLDALLTALGLTLHDLAEALDEVAGRSSPARAGKADARLVSQLAARGALTGDYLEGLAAAATTPAAAADFIATVEAAAGALAERALERARAGARTASDEESR